MNNFFKIFVGFLVIIIGFIILAIYSKSNIDWRKTYETKDKIPFGCYILSKELPKVIPGKKVHFVSYQPENILEGNDSISGTYLSIENIHYSLLDQSLISFVEKGNDLFLSTNIKSLYSLGISTDFINKPNAEVTLVNEQYSSKKYYFDKITDYHYFSEIKDEFIILGEVDGKPNFIKYPQGKGFIYINLLPEAYTNYYMLNDKNLSYALNSLSYIKSENIYWSSESTYVDNGINKKNEIDILYFIKKNPPLYWAFLIGLIGLIVYTIFFGKRLQRVIPKISSLRNTTVEFVQTIGNMYFNTGDYSDAINKKIKYFLFFVKGNYFMDIDNIDEGFSTILHQKSGVSKEITDKIVYHIMNKKSNYNEDDLIKINTAIDNFYKKTKHGGK